MTLLSSGIYCFVFCIGSVAPAKPVPAPDTFCSVYRQQVTSAQEFEAIRTLPRSLRDKMQGNDLYYMCKCQGWDAPECQKSLK